MKKWLLNPFEFIAGAKSLLIGLTGICITILLAYPNQIHFDGALGIHLSKDTPLWFYFVQGIIGWLSLALTLFIAGKIFSSSSIRMIDVFGTIAFARIPDILISLIAFALPLNNLKSTVQNEDIKKFFLDLEISDVVTLTIMAIITVLVSIWVIVLMWKAYSISCNVTGPKGRWSFAIGLIVAEISSQTALYFVSHNYLV